MDKHFWKNAYKNSWDISSEKELFIKDLIEKETGFTVTETGLGAGSSDFIAGDAKDNNLKKGDADLYVVEVDAFIEVTGANIPLSPKDPLWIRPDKLNNTYKKLKEDKGKLHLVIHVLDVKGTGEKLIRGINLNDSFFNRGKAGEFRKITPTIRGREENYIEIPATDKCILSFDEVVDLLKSSA